MSGALNAEVTLLVADSPDRVAAARELFREYAATLAHDLSHQNFDAELADLPGDYAAPSGRLLLAFTEGELAGCGAFRALTHADHDGACEMKRLYVRPAFRGRGLALGRRLAQALMDEARRAGHKVMLLDSLADMQAAHRLYAGLGFREIAPYRFNPNSGVRYLKADLSQATVGALHASA